MIDQLVNRRALRSDDLTPDPNYSPRNACVSTNLSMPKNANGQLLFRFTPWHPSREIYDLQTIYLKKAGVAVATIEGHPQLLEPHPHRVVESYAYFLDAAKNYIDAMSSEFDQTSYFAPSSGNIALTLIASRDPAIFTGATMLTPGRLVDAVWRGKRTVALKRVLQDQNWTRETLEDAWQSLTPPDDMAAFNGKQVNVLVATKDQNIPPDCQEAVVQSLYKAGAMVRRSDLPFGHYATIGLAMVTGHGDRF